MILKYVITIFTVAILVAGCDKQKHDTVYVATINPVAEIIREIAGPGIEVVCLTQPGDSPHTFSPRPSQMIKIESAKAFFYVSDNLDSWVSNVTTENKIQLIKLFPADMVMNFEDAQNHEDGDEHGDGHGHDSGIDPHFWTDPITVKALVPLIVEVLIHLDPENSKLYVDNSVRFISKLDSLDAKVKNLLSSVKGKPVLLFHPSFRYFLKRYELKYIGSVEPSPGKESSPKYLADIVALLRSEGAKAVFYEPQLPNNPAKAVAEASGAKVYELDPNGGTPGRKTYFELIMYNAEILKKALQ